MRTIQVTQSHIDRGDPRNCAGCPIALALKDATDHNWWVGVRSAMSSTITRILPTEASAFINAFDCGAEVEPFEFVFGR